MAYVKWRQLLWIHSTTTAKITVGSSSSGWAAPTEPISGGGASTVTQKSARRLRTQRKETTKPQPRRLKKNIMLTTICSCRHSCRGSKRLEYQTSPVRSSIRSLQATLRKLLTCVFRPTQPPTFNGAWNAYSSNRNVDTGRRFNAGRRYVCVLHRRSNRLLAQAMHDRIMLMSINLWDCDARR